MDQSFDVTASEESIHNHNICEICNYSTGDKSNFNKHMKRHKTTCTSNTNGTDVDESTCYIGGVYVTWLFETASYNLSKY